MNATEGDTRSYTSAGDRSVIGLGVGTAVGDGIAKGMGVFVGVGDGVGGGVGVPVGEGGGIAVRVGVAVGTLVFVASDKLAASPGLSDRGSSVHPTADIEIVPIIKPTTMA